MLSTTSEGRTEVALAPCFKTPLEAGFAAFEMLLEVGAIDIALADSKDSKRKPFKLVQCITSKNTRAKNLTSTP